ncbi:hypothetical protein IC006_2460 [Sulfuracidifex tepidarius]|uniref:Uncharacterized protein n=1 Tax=Sulfuracidifex tepidarius TaxID=1294262 RepID=A0A510DY43_9CREN|nr:hypothetical protein [Sulfuracidifex tepidarius]BBG25125.1 hypothetical protein IC006_2460 [Sulfuracidifex tepidarius]
MTSVNNEITLRASRDRVRRWISDPFLFAGIVGHISIVNAFDWETKKPIELSSVSSPSNKFRVVYVLGSSDIKTYNGEMTGPLHIPSGVIYKGKTDDEKIKWEVAFTLRSVKPYETLVNINVVTECKHGLMNRISGRSLQFAEHVMNGHIVPYLRNFFKPSADSLELIPMLVLKDKGKIGSLYNKLDNISKDISYGIIIIEGEDLRGRVMIKDGKFTKASINRLEKNLAENVEILEIGSTSDVNVYVYAINVDEIVSDKLMKLIPS